MIIVPTQIWNNLALGELKKTAQEFYKENFKGKKVKNKDRGIIIEMTSTGIRHVLHARNVGYVKLKAIYVLDKMLEQAEFTNFKDRDADDFKEIIGYMNFKVSVMIEENLHKFRIVVRITKDGKFYYDHAVKVKK